MTSAKLIRLNLRTSAEATGDDFQQGLSLVGKQPPYHHEGSLSVKEAHTKKIESGVEKVDPDDFTGTWIKPHLKPTLLSWMSFLTYATFGWIIFII